MKKGNWNLQKHVWFLAGIAPFTLERQKTYPMKGLEPLRHAMQGPKNIQ
jgi:hypothetical protein